MVEFSHEIFHVKTTTLVDVMQGINLWTGRNVVKYNAHIGQWVIGQSALKLVVVVCRLEL